MLEWVMIKQQKIIKKWCNNSLDSNKSCLLQE